MITGEIKNRIDNIWDTFWTGGITNPIDVVSQLTYLLFMKLLDDEQMRKEGNAAMLGVQIANPLFKQGVWTNPDTRQQTPYEQLRWHVFKNLDGGQMFNLVRNEVFSFIKNLNDGGESAYSRYMKDAVFLIQNPRTLQQVVDDISALDMTNRDAMGDVYEYVLGKMAASGNNGQFRTPRHIIRMMVELMKPTVDDVMCDPAMGSAGFVVETAKYVKEHYAAELMRNDVVEHYRNGMFHGFDTDTTMLRIGAMNLMLHDVDNPDVKWQNSLSAENTDTNRYSLCLANPPFAGKVDKGDIAASLTAMASTKATELLFVSLFIRMLQIGGRCASIVPDGVLFGSSTAHKSIRKELVENQRLQAVISMPSGVFQPYSGVSTAILVFTKTNAGGTDNVWFYDMTADGYSLDQKRNEVKECDIPDIIARFHNMEGEKDRTRKDKSFLVPVEEIRNNGYDLSINKYKEIEREEVIYEAPEVIFGRLEEREKAIKALMDDFKSKFLK